MNLTIVQTDKHHWRYVFLVVSAASKRHPSIFLLFVPLALQYLQLILRNTFTSFLYSVIFWIGSGLSVFAGIVRALLPESQMFIEAREAERLNPNPEKNKNRAFMRELGVMLKVSF